MTDIVSRITARSLVIASVVGSLVTIFVCYGLAVKLGHVPAWLPMISDCAVEAPEKYFFRFGLILSAGLMAIGGFLGYSFMAAKTGNGWYNYIGLFCSTIASTGLAIVGSVNEVENNPVHSGSAVVFFVGYLIYMWILVIRLYTKTRARVVQVSTPSLLLKAVCALVALVSLVLLATWSQHWGENATRIAEMEWLATFSIQGFNLSCYAEYGPTYDVATVFDTTLKSRPFRHVAYKSLPFRASSESSQK